MEHVSVVVLRRLGSVGRNACHSSVGAARRSDRPSFDRTSSAFLLASRELGQCQG